MVALGIIVRAGSRAGKLAGKNGRAATKLP
jgi:hypothetical protein